MPETDLFELEMDDLTGKWRVLERVERGKFPNREMAVAYLEMLERQAENRGLDSAAMGGE